MKTKKREGFKFIKVFPKTEPIVSMIQFKEKIIVATTRRIYELKKDKLVPIKSIQFEERVPTFPPEEVLL